MVMTREARSLPDQRNLGIDTRFITSENLKPLCVRIPQAARLLGIGRSMFYQLIQSGEIEVIKLGGASLIPVDSLEAYVEALRARSRS